MMRILTVRQPWAWAIVHAGKDVENRSSNIAGDYRGPVAIHSGVKHNKGTWQLFFETAPDAKSLVEKLTDKLVYGSIIGIVDLIDVHKCLGRDGGCISATGEQSCSPWALDSEKYHLVLANPRPIEPIEYKGFLGLRTITESEVLAAIESQLLKSK